MAHAKVWTIRQMLLRVESLFAVGFICVFINAVRGSWLWHSFLPDAVTGIALLIVAMIAFGAIAANSERQARAGMKIALGLSALWFVWMLVRLFH